MSFIVQLDNGVTVDLKEGLVRKNGHSVPLTPCEFDLLACIVRCNGRVASEDFLLSTLYVNPADVSDRTLKARMSCIRKKLGVDLIETEWEKGYRLSKPVQNRKEVCLNRMPPVPDYQ